MYKYIKSLKFIKYDVDGAFLVLAVWSEETCWYCEYVLLMNLCVIFWEWDLVLLVIYISCSAAWSTSCISNVSVFSCCFYNTYLPDIPHFFKSYFNIIIPSKSMASKWSHFLRFVHQNPSWTSVFHHTFYKLRPPHSSWSGYWTIFGQEYKSWNYLCNFMQSPSTSCLLSPNIFLSTKFTKALNLCSSSNKKDQLSQLHRRTAELYSGIFLNKMSVIHFRMFRTKNAYEYCRQLLTYFP